MPSWGSRNPGVPDEEGGRIGQGVVGKHGDHTSLRVFKRDAAVLGIDLHVHDVPRRVLLLGCGNVIVEGIETLAFGTAQDLPPPDALLRDSSSMPSSELSGLDSSSMPTKNCASVQLLIRQLVPT